MIVPAYNEGSGIRGVIEELVHELKKTGVLFEVIVVNNGSTDNTTSILDQLREHTQELVVVRVFPNQGFGNGILTGMAHARGNVLGWMPGDGQLDAKDLVVAYFYLKNRRLDVVKGVRTVRNDNFFRFWQSKIYNFLFRILFTVPYSDINAPPKLFTRTVYEALALASKDWFLDAELILRAHTVGYLIGEACLPGQQRKWGRSKVVRFLTVCEFIKNMLKYKINHAPSKTNKT